MSTRIVAIIGIAILYVSAGANWMYFSSAGYGVNYLDVIGNAENYVYHGNVFDNSTIDGETWVAFLPQLTESGVLIGSILMFAASAVLGLVAIFRWRFMPLAGAFAILSGALWVWGIDLVSAKVNSVLNAFLVYTGQSADSSLYPQVGPYIAAAGGVVLLVGFFLGRVEKLDHPLDYVSP
jgi:hypothetical protein